jgi:hypothetical protein
LALQASLLAHPAQVFFVRSQIGVEAEQLVSLVHCTQVLAAEHAIFPAALQSESIPHSAQAPEDRHTGAAVDRIVQAILSAQAPHACVVVLQIGATGDDLQSALALQATHLPSAHTGVAGLPAHCVFALHSWQELASAPVPQTGCAADSRAQSPSEQATQRCASQNGFAGMQSACMTQDPGAPPVAGMPPTAPPIPPPPFPAAEPPEPSSEAPPVASVVPAPPPPPPPESPPEAP